MKLKKGDKAPVFSVKDIFGNDINLSDYKGKKLYISFFRHVKCPFCNVRVHRLMGKRVALEQSGLKVISFFENSDKIIKSSVLHQGLMPWPMVGDLEKVIYAKYGVEESILKMMKTFMVHSELRKTIALANTLDSAKEKDSKHTNSLIPADFLINEDQTIEVAHYGAHADDHIHLDEVLKFAGIRVF
jgi:peroxiredoxin